jgi:perosamine synthetase
LRSARNLAFGREQRFVHTAVAHQYRLTNLQAALAGPQIERISQTLVRKRWLGEAYTSGLANVTSLELPAQQPWARHVYWMYGVVLSDDARLGARELASRLANRGIETRPFFTGMHEQPALRARGLFANEQYPVAERLARRGLYLPSGLGLTEIQLQRVCDAVREVIA